MLGTETLGVLLAPSVSVQSSPLKGAAAVCSMCDPLLMTPLHMAEDALYCRELAALTATVPALTRAAVALSREVPPCCTAPPPSPPQWLLAAQLGLGGLPRMAQG